MQLLPRSRTLLSHRSAVFFAAGLLSVAAHADILSASGGGYLLSNTVRATNDEEADFDVHTPSAYAITSTKYASGAAEMAQTLTATTFSQSLTEASNGEHDYHYSSDGTLYDDGDNGEAIGFSVSMLQVSAGYYYFHDDYSSLSDGNWAAAGNPNVELFGTSSGINIAGPYPNVTNQLGSVDWQGYLPDCAVSIATGVSSGGYGGAGSANYAYFGTQPVPEPGSFVPLGLGVTMLLRRRRSRAVSG